MSQHVDFFDSLAEEGKWLPDIKVCLLICCIYTSHVIPFQQDVVSLVLRLAKVAAAHGHSIDLMESGWTPSPTSVSPLLKPILPPLTTIRWTACKRTDTIVGFGF
jgi:hypothetical protein